MADSDISDARIDARLAAAALWLLLALIAALVLLLPGKLAGSAVNIIIRPV